MLTLVHRYHDFLKCDKVTVWWVNCFGHHILDGSDNIYNGFSIAVNRLNLFKVNIFGIGTR